jgi:hypothetical protein
MNLFDVDVIPNRLKEILFFQDFKMTFSHHRVDDWWEQEKD